MRKSGSEIAEERFSTQDRQLLASHVDLCLVELEFLHGMVNKNMLKYPDPTGITRKIDILSIYIQEVPKESDTSPTHP